jgi:ABC-type multidrug transport system fused ATPase/permease subunit
VLSFLGARTVRLFFWTIVIGVLWFVVETSFVFVLQGFLSSLGFIDRSTAMVPRWFPNSMAWSVGSLVLFGVVRSTVMWLRLHLSQVISVRFSRDQRAQLMHHIFRGLDDVVTSEVVVLFNQIVAQGAIVLVAAGSLSVTLVASGLFLLFGLWLAPLETVIGLCFLAVGIAPLQYLNHKLTQYGQAMLECSLQVNGVLTSGIRNMFLLRVYGVTELESKKGLNALSEQENVSVRASALSSFGTAAPLLVGVLVISAVTMVNHHFSRTPPATLVAFFYVFLRLSQSVSEAKTTLDQLKLNFPGLVRLYKWGQDANSRTSTEVRVPSLNEETREKLRREFYDRGVNIEARRIFFGYEPGQELLGGLSFSVKPGRPLVIKGESGVGKSTLSQIVLGVLKPDSGDVLINGHKMSEAVSEARELIGYVGPDPFLVRGSLRENLFYGLSPSRAKDLDDSTLWDALNEVGLGNVVSALPRGLDYILHESAQFSTGQKQRLAIARALLRRPRLWVFDEATANLDVETEAKIVSLIARMKRDAVLVITHKGAFDRLGGDVLTLQKKYQEVRA